MTNKIPHCLNVFGWNKKYPESIDDVELFLKCLRKFYSKWFKGSKTYSDEHVAEQIFKKIWKVKDVKTWVQYELAAVIKSFERILEDVKLDKSNANGEFKFEAEFGLLKDMAVDAIIFLDAAHYYVEGSYAGYGFGKSNTLISFEIFEAAQKFFKRQLYIEKSLGVEAIQPTSIFLIRQAIEVRLRRAFGIRSIEYKSGKPLRFPGIIFMKIIRKNPDHIKFPVKSSLLIKIYDWTQYYIHTGVIPRVWEVEWAFYILKPLFTAYHEKRGKSENFALFGSIKIDKLFYSQIEEEVKAILKSPGEEDVVIKRSSQHESMIVESL